LRKEKREFIGKAETLKETRNKQVKQAKGIFLTSDVISMEKNKDRKE